MAQVFWRLVTGVALAAWVAQSSRSRSCGRQPREVLATARNIKSLSELSERYGDQVKPFALDVADEAAAAAAVKTLFAIDAFGSLDVL